MSICIVPMTDRHTAAIAALERSCFADPWSENGLREELNNPCAAFLVATEGDRVVGYVGCHHVGDEGYITNVAVDPSCRRQGIARRLLTYAMDAWGDLARITLEVRVSNAAAIALYEGLGFTRDGIRPKFYTHPTEDAAIYSFWR